MSRAPGALKASPEVVAGGDLFESGRSTLVNAVNCHGVMGAGIALEFKRRFPAMFADYRRRCRQGEVRLGRPYLWRPEDGVGSSVLNFPTKDHWRDPSHLEAIVDGLAWLRTHYREWGIASLAVPALGCGHGGLRWTDAGPILIKGLSSLEIPVMLYLPGSSVKRRAGGCAPVAEGGR
jgi:O-acetyl-ADP-ribose deacetylase (regulator of RNase III)